MNLGVVLADTGYWLALLRRGDALHARARAWQAWLVARLARILTLDWGLAELVALSAARPAPQRPALVAFIEAVRSARTIEVVHVTRQIRDDAWDLLAADPSREWSWTDACAIVVMRARGLEGALAEDRHFAEAGLTPLLRLDPASFT